MAAYYNEIDPAAAAILRELIDRNVIPRGDVDTRSIKEVTADDVRGYTQCHFFAGGGLWAVAGRLAGWPDDKPWWTGSCPCQPFSAAGKGGGVNDPRHLWPDLFRLVSACRPSVIMGEQVAGTAGYGWFDGVRADLARENYAARAVDIPACSIDAPHQRNRLYLVAVDDRIGARLEGQRGHGDRGEGRQGQAGSIAATDDFVLADAESLRRGEGRSEYELWGGRNAAPSADVQLQPLRNVSWWSDSDWIISPIDGKARRTKPGLTFLVDGLPGRVDLWRVCGNAISPVLAAEVIAAYLETEVN